MQVSLPKKTCSNCKELKPLMMFNRSRHSADGLNNVCKQCVKEKYGKSLIRQIREHQKKQGTQDKFQRPSSRKFTFDKYLD